MVKKEMIAKKIVVTFFHLFSTNNRPRRIPKGCCFKRAKINVIEIENNLYCLNTLEIKNIHKKIIRSIFNCVINKLVVALIDRRLNSNSFKPEFCLSELRNIKKSKYNIKGRRDLINS